MSSEKPVSFEEGTDTFFTYPLTHYDTMFERLAIVMGWLVEGQVELGKIEKAYDRVIAKWPMLTGRHDMSFSLLMHPTTSYQLRIPLGSYPEGYKPYILTSSVSERPLSDYVKLPMEMSTEPLPASLFRDKQSPSTTNEWIVKKLPIICWHVTYFTEGDSSYSCIGLSFPHVVFDGLGIASVIHAVVAELLNKPWVAPPSLFKENLLQVTLAKAEDKMRAIDLTQPDYISIGAADVWFIIYYIAWHCWQQVWNKSTSRMLRLPSTAVAKLVEDTRKALPEAQNNSIRITRGDILAAWLFKTVYSDETPSNKPIYLSSLASLRRFFDGDLQYYPHNCVIPLPYPMFTTRELAVTSVACLASKIATVRSSFCEEDALRAQKKLYNTIKMKRSILACNTITADTINLTNMSIANIVNIDWTGAGSGRTLCRYKSVLNEHSPIQLTNITAIVGYLDDGTLLLDVHYPRRRLDKLEGAMRRLIEEVKTES
ncbi:hypothetical protein B0H34DRAFT_656837 [Crassisporium funariophilum]|nr:hypothetical protein B0H34DRAFT_656837 [Crassisporium funariophilum]